MSPSRPKSAPATAFPQRDARVLGLRLRYVDVAPDREEDLPLLLVHGHASRLEEYDEIVPRLAKRRRVIVPDLPGCGYSDKPDAPYTLRLYEDVLLALLDSLGVREAHVAGGSLGGHLTLRLAHREPERFARLAPWAPAGAWDRMHGWARFAAFMRGMPGALFWMSLWVQSRFWYSRRWKGRVGALESAFRYYREVFGVGFRRAYWDIGEDQAKTSVLEVAHAIPHPTLLSVGDEDHALGMFDGVKRLAGVMPDAKLVVYPGARHSLANELAETLATDVDAFLAARGRAR